ncbi:Mediator of RNA polymerase II transcription subunit 34 [Raphanus sativus]|uniref:ATP-dependent DNA helicase n=1 Tax=Raphanus sativus TaxID=3726 RepID=A0A9W3C933_RAPSA|nr:ATP-dependent DNA helicase Q-like 2 isoform X1 [Raphanus sativus]KAJ4881280.1 Mediator of RNA polymerase II transcription subunit 34 [Raphanus sativus]
MESEAIQDELQSLDLEINDVQGQISALIEHQDRLYERKSELKTLLKAVTAGTPVASSCPAVENWSEPFEWDSRADDIRFNMFGISKYRANQREIINAVMAGRDVLVIMAAGGGKSLCYQLPAILRGGTTLVVSPLLSLIQDQVMGLAALGISAYMLTSTSGKENEKFVYKALEKGEDDLKILYVTPEKVSKSKRFMSKLEKCHNAGRLSLISIDEAHCCSQWGHDFRPDYKNLSILKTQFPKVPMVALTATATQKVQNDLIEMLHIPKCVKFVSSVNRPNLFYSVREKSLVGKAVVDEIAEFIRESYSNNESGIVYCFSRKECEQIAGELRERGISADYYHAEMDVNLREKVHMRWSKNKLQVIVGTVAFGMGINKPDVRFVIHHSLSKSMETYYQESGRAGRDGLPSECVLFFRSGDVPRQSSMVFYEYSGLQNLYDIVRYCQSKTKCRRSAFFRHFGEPSQDCNGMCDNCALSSEVKEVDVSDLAKLVVSMVQEMQAKDQRVTMLQLGDKLRTKHKDLSAELKREEIEHLVIKLIVDSVLKEEFQHTPYSTNAYVTMGPLANQLLQGRKTIKTETSSRQMNKKSKRSSSLSGLESKLDELRKEISAAHGSMLPHTVLSTQQIGLISSQKPDSLQELESIIGKLKTDKYGDKILEVMRHDAVSEQHVEDATKDETCKRRSSKRAKTQKDVVLLESSEEEEEA